jgi:1,2-diacylglycerol-3-alpha-glucose alpha-1,2-glucosyltransferase
LLSEEKTAACRITPPDPVRCTISNDYGPCDTALARVASGLNVKFVVTPVGLMMGNIESAKRLAKALAAQGVTVSDERGHNDYDILHVHTPFPPRNMRLVERARREGKRVVIHAHTTVEDSVGTWTGSWALAALTEKYLTHFYNLGDLVIAPSEWTKERLRTRGVKVGIRVLSNGVDLERFRFLPERRERFRSAHGIPSESVVAYSIGVLCLKKGIEVYPEVVSRLPSLGFVWVGRSSLLYHPGRIRRAMMECASNARFLHDVEDIVDAHCGCDLFFTPSYVENQGMAILEAMAVGRPIVARNLKVYEGLLANGVNSLTCRGNDEFISALDLLRADENRARSLVNNARETVRAHDMRNITRQLIDIYRSLLDGRREDGALA